MNNNSLFFLCSLIEFIGRQQKQSRGRIVEFLGENVIKRIYDYADVFHCEPIEKVADMKFRIIGRLAKCMSV